MAFNISSFVESAQFTFTAKNACHGFIKFFDSETPCPVSLTGTCAPDLRGKRIEFAPNPDIKTDPPDGKLAAHLPNQQNGVTGEMTAERWVRYHGCAPSEFIRRARAGERPPCEWKRGIYLEWYSGNGRVLIELIDPLISYALPVESGNATGDFGQWMPLPLPPRRPMLSEVESELGEQDKANRALREAFPFGESLDRVRRENPLFNDSGTAEKRRLDEEYDSTAPSSPAVPADDIDAYLDSLSRAADTSAGLSNSLGLDPKDPLIKEMDLMEDIIEGRHDGDDLMTAMLPERGDLEGLTEVEAEIRLKTILAGLALYNIVVHQCEHFSSRETLVYLYDTIAPVAHIHPDLIGTGWITHYDTSENCEGCMNDLKTDWDLMNDQPESENWPGNPPF